MYTIPYSEIFSKDANDLNQQMLTRIPSLLRLSSSSSPLYYTHRGVFKELLWSQIEQYSFPLSAQMWALLMREFLPCISLQSLHFFKEEIRQDWITEILCFRDLFVTNIIHVYNIAYNRCLTNIIMYTHTMCLYHTIMSYPRDNRGETGVSRTFFQCCCKRSLCPGV